MNIRKKYRPDYHAIYSGIDIGDQILDVLKKGDRKEEYMEYDLKRQRVLKGQDGQIVNLLPGREDSLERLNESGIQFEETSILPDDIYLERECCRALYSVLAELEAHERALIYALFFDCLTEQAYADRIGKSQKAVNLRKHKVLEKMTKLLQSKGFGT